MIETYAITVVELHLDGDVVQAKFAVLRQFTKNKVRFSPFFTSLTGA